MYVWTWRVYSSTLWFSFRTISSCQQAHSDCLLAWSCCCCFFLVAAINFIITLVCHCKVQKQHATYIKTVSTKVNVNRCALHSGMTALLTNRTHGDETTTITTATTLNRYYEWEESETGTEWNWEKKQRTKRTNKATDESRMQRKMGDEHLKKDQHTQF